MQAQYTRTTMSIAREAIKQTVPDNKAKSYKYNIQQQLSQWVQMQ